MEAMLLTVPETAQALRLGRTTVRELICSGGLRVVRIGRAVRVPRIEIERWIAAHIIGPVEPAA